MYCTECGNAVSEDQRFCTNCGAKVWKPGDPVNTYTPVKNTDSTRCGAKVGEFHIPTSTGRSVDSIGITAKEMKANFTAGTAGLGKNKALFFVNIALLLLSLVLGFMENFAAESHGYSRAMSLFAEAGSSFLLFWIAAYILSASCLLIPLLLGKNGKKLFYLPAKVTTILAMLWFLLAWISGIDSAKTQSSRYDLSVEFGPTVAGWLFLIVTVCVIVLTFKLAKDYKKT